VFPTFIMLPSVKRNNVRRARFPGTYYDVFAPVLRHKVSPALSQGVRIGVARY